MDIESAIQAVRRLPPHGLLAREAARLRRDEVDASLALAGNALTRPEIDALADRAAALGGHQLADYVAARDLLAAANWVAEQRPIGVADPRPLITIEDIRKLHALATAGQPAARPGVWRLAVDQPGTPIVSPPPWLVAKETAALVERVRRRPALADVPGWLARFLARYARIRPFASANGRAARLAAGLLLRRLDMVPFALPRDRAAEYQIALIAAESGDERALRALIASTLVMSCRRLIAAADADPLVPLRTLAGANYAALIKAAKRGGLPTIVTNGRVYTTAGWLTEYRSRRGRQS